MSHSIRCPECGAVDSKVVDSRWTGEKHERNRSSVYINSVRRRRECENGHRYTTIESIADASGVPDPDKIVFAAKRMVRQLLAQLTSNDEPDSQPESPSGSIEGNQNNITTER